MIASAPVIAWNRPRRRVLFALTPLIDVMFLLLIFFMLSSQIAPYSIMPVGGVAAAGSAAAATAETQAAPLVVRLSHGRARIGGRDIPLAELQSTAQGFVNQGVSAFLVMPGAEADAQDVVTALEALKAAAAAEVTLVSAGGARP